jgi:HEAT repeat protein
MQELTNLARDKDATAEDKIKVLSYLRDAALEDSTWQLRNQAISNISQILLPRNSNTDAVFSFDGETINTLTKAAGDKHSQVRGNAISLLGLTKDKKFAPIYKRAINDQSYFVINKAARALANTNDTEAYFVLRKTAQTDSWKNNIQIAGLNALAILKDKRALDLGFKFATDKTQPLNVQTAAVAIIGAVGKGDPRTFPIVLENFKIAVENSNFQSIISGIETIINLADPRGQEAFDLFREKFKGNPQAEGFIKTKEAEFKKTIQENKK